VPYGRNWYPRPTNRGCLPKSAAISIKYEFGISFWVARDFAESGRFRDFLRSHAMADLGGALHGVGRLHLGAD
jgi:hypothetical protein